MKLLSRWKLLVGQTMALIPIVSSPLAHANQVAMAGIDGKPQPSNDPLVFKNTLNSTNAVNIYAAHRSHSSHSSHRSHSSHYSGSGGYSAPRVYTSPTPSPSPNTIYSNPSPSSGSIYGTGSNFSGSSNNSSASATPQTGSTISKTRPAANDLAQLLMRVQMALMVKQYYTGAIDGVMGKSTRGALLAFQMDSGLGVNGKMDTPTLNALGIAIP